MLESKGVQCSNRCKWVLWFLSAKVISFNTRNNTELIADKDPRFHSPLVKNQRWADTSAGVSSHLCDREWERRERHFHTWNSHYCVELPIGKTMYVFHSPYWRGNKAHICTYREWKINYMGIIPYFTTLTYIFGTVGSKNSSFWNKHLHIHKYISLYICTIELKCHKGRFPSSTSWN